VSVTIGFLENEESNGDSGDSPNYIQEYREDLPTSVSVNLRAEPDVFHGTSVYFGGEASQGAGPTGMATFQPEYSGSERPTSTFPAYLSYSGPEPGSLGPQMGKVDLTFTMPQGSDFLPALRKLARAEGNDLEYAEDQRSFKITSTNPYGINETLNEDFNETLQSRLDDLTAVSAVTLVILTGGAAAPLLIGGGTAATALGGFYMAVEGGLWAASLLSEPVESGGVTTLASAVLGSGTNVITGNPEDQDLSGCDINEEGVIPRPENPREVGTKVKGAIPAKSGPFVTAGDISRRLQYTDVAVPGASYGDGEWGQADTDSREELVLSGDVTQGEELDPLTRVFEVTNGQLNSLDVDIVNVGFSDVAWGNADQSGGPQDLVVAGFTRDGFEPVTELYQSQGSGFEAAEAGLVGVGQGDVEWVDYNKDGNEDLIVSGYQEGSLNPADPITQLYRNTGGDFEAVSDAGLVNVGQSEVAWADVDGDGDLDLAISGRREDGAPVTRLYRNTGGGFEAIGADVPDVAYSSLAWGDYNNDSSPDLVVSGRNDSGQAILHLYENDGGSFSLAMDQPLGIAKGDAEWNDFNNDGFPDLVVMGEASNSDQTRMIVIRNAPGDEFGEVRLFSGARHGSVSWGDYDGDGDTDLLQIGEQSGGSPFGGILENLQ
jgi:hypothetical protein